MIGMNTAVASDTSGNAPTQNIGFAITVNSVKPLLAKLRTGRHRRGRIARSRAQPGGQLRLHRGDRRDR